MLLKAGADLEVGNAGCSTPLMEAAQEGHLELVRRLLNQGANVNAITATGDTALHHAAENGHAKVCRELLGWGASAGQTVIIEGCKTPLMKAARAGHLEVVQLLIEWGFPIDQSTSQNDATALSLACNGGHVQVSFASRRVFVCTRSYRQEFVGVSITDVLLRHVNMATVFKNPEAIFPLVHHKFSSQPVMIHPFLQPPIWHFCDILFGRRV